MPVKRFGYINLEDFHKRYPVPTTHTPKRIDANRVEMKERGYLEEWQYMHLCGTCNRLFERHRPGGQNQKCSCSPGPRESWSGFDFAERARLCMCCGLTVLKSGSRYSQFFCGTCKQFAIGVSLWHQQLVFPLGRHSFMNGFVTNTLPATLAAHGGSVRKLAASVYTTQQGISAGIQLLEQWYSRIISYNRQVLAAEGEMVLAEYVSAAARETRLDARTAFAAMSEYARVQAATQSSKKRAVNYRGKGQRTTRKKATR